MDNYLISKPQFVYQRKVVLLIYFIFYYGVIISFGLSHRLLSQYHPSFFTHNRDLSELIIIGTGLQGWMIQHPFTFFVADTFIILVPILLIVHFLRKSRFSERIGIIFTFGVYLYLLLQSVFTQLSISILLGFFFLAFAFATNKENRFYFALDLCRYAFLYLFFSAAIWKIARGSIWNIHEMSNILILQHSDFLINNCDTFFCQLYRYLIDHQFLSYSLYITAVLIELFFIVGFFTRKLDRILLLLAILFFAVDHIIMRISFWPMMVSGITLLLKTEPVIIFKNKFKMR